MVWINKQPYNRREKGRITRNYNMYLLRTLISIACCVLITIYPVIIAWLNGCVWDKMNKISVCLIAFHRTTQQYGIQNNKCSRVTLDEYY